MYVLDTDVAIEYLKGDEKVVEEVLALKEVYTTVITLAELYYGAYNSPKPEKHKKILVDFAHGIPILGLNLRVTEKFGEIKAELKKKGKPAGDFDIMIASICIAHKCRLITKNKKHYQHILELKIHDL